MARGGAQAIAQRREGRVGDVLDVALAFAEGGDLARVEVEADHLVAGLGEGDGEGEADVTESDDPIFIGGSLDSPPPCSLVVASRAADPTGDAPKR